MTHRMGPINKHLRTRLCTRNGADANYLALRDISYYTGAALKAFARWLHRPAVDGGACRLAARYLVIDAWVTGKPSIVPLKLLQLSANVLFGRETSS